MKNKNIYAIAIQICFVAIMAMLTIAQAFADAPSSDYSSQDVESTNVISPSLFVEETLGVHFFQLGFYEMTLAERAEFSKTWNTIMDAYVESHPYNIDQDDRFYAVTRYTYGLPGKGDMTQEEATALARQRVVQLGANAQTIDRRPIEYYFDITEPEKPKWKLVIFSEDNIDHSKIGYGDPAIAAYRIVINACTAEVLEAFEITPEMNILDYRL